MYCKINYSEMNIERQFVFEAISFNTQISEILDRKPNNKL